MSDVVPDQLDWLDGYAWGLGKAMSWLDGAPELARDRMQVSHDAARALLWSDEEAVS